MKAEDFAAWLLAISGMSGAQRAEALAALERAGAAVEDAEGKASARARGKHNRREDALGTMSAERVAAQGCPHCASRDVVGWGRSDGLLRFRCKSCRRTFNALTKSPMAHLRKKEKWDAHARAMIEGKSLAKTAELCGVHPTTAFRWRHRFLRAPASDKPRALRGIVEADETLVLESFKGRRSDLPRKARKRGGKARHPGLHQDNIPVLVARDRKGATFDAILPQVDGASVRAALASVITPGNHLIGDGRQGDRCFRPQGRHSLPHCACARKANPRCAASAHQQRQRLPRPPQATARPLQPRRHQEPCPTTSDGGAPSKPGATNSPRQTGSKALSETAHTNRQRYKSRHPLYEFQKSCYPVSFSLK